MRLSVGTRLPTVAFIEVFRPISPNFSRLRTAGQEFPITLYLHLFCGLLVVVLELKAANLRQSLRDNRGGSVRISPVAPRIKNEALWKGAERT